MGSKGMGCPAIAVDELVSNRHLPGGYPPVDSAARRIAHSKGIRFPFETMLAQNIHSSHAQGGALAIIPQWVGRRKSVQTERLPVRRVASLYQLHIGVPALAGTERDPGSSRNASSSQLM